MSLNQYRKLIDNYIFAETQVELEIVTTKLKTSYCWMC